MRIQNANKKLFFVVIVFIFGVSFGGFSLPFQRSISCAVVVFAVIFFCECVFHFHFHFPFSYYELLLLLRVHLFASHIQEDVTLCARSLLWACVQSKDTIHILYSFTIQHFCRLAFEHFFLSIFFSLFRIKRECIWRWMAIFTLSSSQLHRWKFFEKGNKIYLLQNTHKRKKNKINDIKLKSNECECTGAVRSVHAKRSAHDLFFLGNFYSPSQTFATSAAADGTVATQATYICITFAMNYNNIYNFQSFRRFCVRLLCFFLSFCCTQYFCLMRCLIIHKPKR